MFGIGLFQTKQNLKEYKQNKNVYGQIWEMYKTISHKLIENVKITDKYYLHCKLLAFIHTVQYTVNNVCL